MKKLLNIALLIATVLLFSACGSDEKDEPSINISQSQIVGLWDAIEVQFDNDDKWIDITNRPDMALSIYFYENGDYYGVGALGTGKGTYTFNRNTIKTYVDGDLYATYIAKSLVGDIAELLMTMGDESMLIKAKKSKLSLKPSDPSIVVSKPTSEDGFVFGGWRSEKLDGNHYVSQSLSFNDINMDAQWVISDYTLNEKGIWSVEIDGISYRANQNFQTITNYRYSFDGSELVLRNIDTKEESVYSASVNGDTLTMSDGGSTNVFIKVMP